MKSVLKITAIVAALATMSACTRIETGEVGLRRNFNKTIDMTERLPGSWNQTIVGDIMTFPVKDVSVSVTNLTPVAKDNSTMKDVDVLVTYSINPSSVAELWTEKSKSFHATSKDGEDTFLMYNYIAQLAQNATFKAVRPYEALLMNDSRSDIEASIMREINEKLKEEKLETAIIISQVQAQKLLPADTVVQSANELVRAKNENAKKVVEVQTAAKEAERIQILNANKGAIEYMDAMSRQTIAQAVADGKVNTIVIPQDFKGILNVK